MAVYRGPDGKIIEEKTVNTGGNDEPTGKRTFTEPTGGGGSSSYEAKTQRIKGGTSGSGGGSAYDVETVRAGGDDFSTRYATDDEMKAMLDAKAAADPKTRVVGGRKKKASADAAASPSSGTDPMADPTVGWLVVVDGPGKGNVRSLGYGMNKIGRGADQRVVLDLGDEDISRDSHATVTYDPRGRKYFLQHGGGTNLTYLDDSPVLTPIDLKPHAHFTVGSTTLRFVPLCGEGFDWQDEE